MATEEKVQVKDENTTGRFHFTTFKGFAAYILKDRLNEAAELNLKLSRELNLPLLDFFNKISEEELFAMSLQGQKDFFQQVINDTAFAKARQSLLLWKLDKLDGIRRDQIKVADLVLSYSIRKQVCMDLLPGYTSDPVQIIAIIQELEKFHQELERMAFQIYLEIQQEELHQGNQFLSSLISNSGDGILAFDSEMKVTEWNSSLEKSLGISKSEIIGKHLLDFYPAIANAPIMEAFQQALQGKAVNLPSSAYTSRTGFYEANITPLKTESGEVSGALAVIHDITYRIEAEERLREHQEELLAANEELTEQQEELQVANEELTEQREEIEAVNEELQESLAQLEEVREALENSVKELEEAQAIAQLGSFEFHLESNHIVWSKEMKRIFGVQEENINLDYEGYLSKLHEDDREWTIATVAKAVEDGQPYSFEHRIVLPDGGIRWLLSHGKPVHANGKVYKISGTAMDITESKLAHIKLEEEQYFVQKITDTTPDVITIFDLDKKVNVYGNRELTSILDYSEEEIKELRKDPAFMQKMVHPDDLEMGFRFLMEFKNYTGTQTRKVEYRLRQKSGNYIWVSARYNVFRRDANGLPTQIIGVTRDINDRKLAEDELLQTNYRLQETNEELVRTEELLKEANNDLEEQVLKRTAELQRKNTQLERINADLDNFIYTASHDLKVPIVNLEGLLILLNKKLTDKLPEKDQNLLNMMQTSIERFKTTIQDLSDVTKMQKDLDEEVKEIIQLPEIVEDVQKDIYQLIAENNATVHTFFEVKEVPFDRKNLRSIIYNLLTNAIKYRADERDPVVTIQTKRVNRGIQLSVSDNGEGIPEHQYEKIFSLFKRLHKKVEGSGMGLYIVKRIIENNGGQIEVKSEVGKGTTFNIFLQDER